MSLSTQLPSMRTVMKLIAGLMVCIAAWLLIPASAHSCPPPDCERIGYFGVDDGAEIPPNTYGIPWAPDSSDDGFLPPEDDHVRLIRDPDGEAIEVDVSVEQTGEFPWLVVPDESFDSGESYELEAVCPRYDADQGGVETVRWTTAEDAAELPQEIGTLQIDVEELTEEIVAASPECSVNASLYVVDLEVELADGASPWEGILQFETHITDDGGDTEIWSPSTELAREHAPGASWMGRTSERLYTHCGDYSGVVDGLDPGNYEVFLSAELPGEDISLTTDGVEATLDCLTTDDNGDGDTSTGHDTGVSEDADGDSSSEQSAENGGCACATSTGPSSMLVLFALVVLMGIRRRETTARCL